MQKTTTELRTDAQKTTKLRADLRSVEAEQRFEVEPVEGEGRPAHVSQQAVLVQVRL